MRFQCERTRNYFRAAMEALPAEDRRSLLAAEIMRAIYYRLLLKIEQQGYNVFEGDIAIPEPGSFFWPAGCGCDPPWPSTDQGLATPPTSLSPLNLHYSRTSHRRSATSGLQGDRTVCALLPRHSPCRSPPPFA